MLRQCGILSLSLGTWQVLPRFSFCVSESCSMYFASFPMLRSFITRFCWFEGMYDKIAQLRLFCFESQFFVADLACNTPRHGGAQQLITPTKPTTLIHTDSYNILLTARRAPKRYRTLLCFGSIGDNLHGCCGTKKTLVTIVLFRCRFFDHLHLSCA